MPILCCKKCLPLLCVREICWPKDKTYKKISWVQHYNLKSFKKMCTAQEEEEYEEEEEELTTSIQGGAKLFLNWSIMKHF